MKGCIPCVGRVGIKKSGLSSSTQDIVCASSSSGVTLLNPLSLWQHREHCETCFASRDLASHRQWTTTYLQHIVHFLYLDTCLCFVRSVVVLCGRDGLCRLLFQAHFSSHIFDATTCTDVRTGLAYHSKSS